MELFILFLILLLSLLLEVRFRIILFNSTKERLSITGVAFAVLIGWELINRHLSHSWIYPGNGLVGISIFGVPIELYFFALITPYFSFVIYELVNEYL